MNDRSLTDRLAITENGKVNWFGFLGLAILLGCIFSVVSWWVFLVWLVIGVLRAKS